MKFVSLFSGCGGLDSGFVEAGFTAQASFDIDPVAVKVNALNLPGKVIEADLSTYPLEAFNALGRVDVLVSGSPCQGFSTMGGRAIDDPRNYLLGRAGEIALSLKPKVFVAENVVGALCGSHRQFWERLDSGLRGAGYQTKTLILNARDFGMAQSRKRAVLFAWRTQKNFSLLPPSLPGATLASVLDGVSAQSGHVDGRIALSDRDLRIAPHIPAGKKLCNVRGEVTSVPTWKIPQVFGPTTTRERTILEEVRRLRRVVRRRDFGDADPVSLSELSKVIKFPLLQPLSSLVGKGYLRSVEGYYDLTNSFNGKYRRLSWSSHSITVDTRFGQARYFLHPQEDRGFSVREAARLQGFPDAYKFLCTPAQAFRLIGNAVPPPMADYIARAARCLA